MSRQPYKYSGMGRHRADERGQQARRKCLSCGKKFRSEHKGNRMCKFCLVAAAKRRSALD